MYIRQSRAIGRKQQQEVQKNTSWKQICKQKTFPFKKQNKTVSCRDPCTRTVAWIPVFMYSKIVFRIKLYTVSKRFLNNYKLFIACWRILTWHCRKLFLEQNTRIKIDHPIIEGLEKLCQNLVTFLMVCHWKGVRKCRAKSNIFFSFITHVFHWIEYGLNLHLPAV